MKLNRINALLLTLGVALTSAAIFADKSYANHVATSTANFNGAVPLAAAVTGGGFGGAVTYTPAVVAGASGGPTTFSATVTSGQFFDTNSDLTGVAFSVVTSRPIPTNATSLLANHRLTYSVTGAATSAPVTVLTTTNGLAAETFPIASSNYAVDPNGDIGISLTSAWSGGEDLFTGTYTAAVTATVTPQ